MIDQLVSGAPQAQQPVKASQGGRQQAAADQDDTSGNFDDLVAKAGARNPRDERRQGEVADKTGGVASDTATVADGLSKLSSSLDALLRGMASNGEGRVKIANFKDALKTIDLKGQPVDQQEAIIAKLFDKLKQAAVAQAKQLADDAAGATDAKADLSPADELGMLLGLVAKETDPKAEKKSDAVKDVAKEVAKDDAADTSSAVDIVAAKLEAKGQQPVPASAVDMPRQDRQDRPAREEAVQVVSADGRGRPVDIAVSRTAAEGAKDTDKTSTARIDTATVLEARRYLGFTPDTNATALATAAKADPTWSSALQAVQRVESVTSLANTVSEVNTLKLQMNPENLGNMVASLKLKDDVLTVEVRVDSADAYRQLSADHDDIVKALQDQGFSIDKVTVQLNATERTDTGSDRDMQRQQGQAQREGQGSQSGRNDGRQSNQPAWNSEPKSADVAPVGSNAGIRESGNIYL